MDFTNTFLDCYSRNYSCTHLSESWNLFFFCSQSMFAVTYHSGLLNMQFCIVEIYLRQRRHVHGILTCISMSAVFICFSRNKKCQLTAMHQLQCTKCHALYLNRSNRLLSHTVTISGHRNLNLQNKQTMTTNNISHTGHTVCIVPKRSSTPQTHLI